MLTVEASPTSKPSAPPEAATRPLVDEFTITAIKGIVQVRMSADQPWTKAAARMVLRGETNVRVGIRASVTFTGPDGKTSVLDRLASTTFKEAASGKGRTSAMKYGTTTYDFPPYRPEGSGQRAESRIQTPGEIMRNWGEPAGPDSGLMESGFNWFTKGVAWFVHPW